MEHRWGTRSSLETPVRLDARPHCLAFACLSNASASGGYLKTDAAPPLWTRICIDLGGEVFHRDEVLRVAAYVVRHDESGIGLEWCEFAPPAIRELIESAPLSRALVFDQYPAANDALSARSRGARERMRIAVAP